MTLTVALVLLSFGLAFVFLFFGKWIIRRIPTVARFRRSKQYLLESVRLGFKRIPQGQALSAFCRRESDEVLTWGNNPEEETKLKKMPTGSIVTILHHKEGALNRTILELRVYSLIIIALGAGAIYVHLEKSGFVLKWDELTNWIATSPFQALDAFKIVLVGVFALKLILEILSIRELFKD